MTPLASHGIENSIVPRWFDRAAIIATDELPADRAGGRARAGHIRVNHSFDEFARDDWRTGLRAHLNTQKASTTC